MTCAAGGSYVAHPSSRRKAAKKDFPPDEKLANLRKEFEKAADNNGLDAYIVPSEDAHQVKHFFHQEAEYKLQLLISSLNSLYSEAVSSLC